MLPAVMAVGLAATGLRWLATQVLPQQAAWTESEEEDDGTIYLQVRF